MAAESEELIDCLNCSHRFSNKMRFCPACGTRNQLYVGHKDRVTAGLLAVMFGWLGFHKFYLKQYGRGIVYLFFCWTIIPGVLGLFEGVKFLVMSEEQFWAKY